MRQRELIPCNSSKQTLRALHKTRKKNKKIHDERQPARLALEIGGLRSCRLLPLLFLVYFFGAPDRRPRPHSCMNHGSRSLLESKQRPQPPLARFHNYHTSSTPSSSSLIITFTFFDRIRTRSLTHSPQQATSNNSALESELRRHIYNNLRLLRLCLARHRSEGHAIVVASSDIVVVSAHIDHSSVMLSL